MKINVNYVILRNYVKMVVRKGVFEMREIRKQASEKMNGYCHCKVCDGRFCAGSVPGIGSAKNGSAFIENVRAFNDYQLVLETIDSCAQPKLETTFLGYPIASPIIGAPITSPRLNFCESMSDEVFSESVILGAKQANSIGMIGDTADHNCLKSGVDAINKHGGLNVVFIKPRLKTEIIERLQNLSSEHIIAVGVDLDGAGLVTMAKFNQAVQPLSFEDLKEVIASTDLPFIAKGIMSVNDAQKCVEAGAKAIVVSNHGGRVLSGTQAPLNVLADIVAAVGNEVEVYVDGGFRYGEDVLKALALGANGVLVGRPIIWGALSNEADGVSQVLTGLNNELYQAMILTNNPSVKAINQKNIVKVK